MEWSFHYDGPVNFEDSRRCATCQAKALTECPTHGKQFADGCAHCDAAKGAPCRSHWGVKAALEAHPVPVAPKAAADWTCAKDRVLAELAEHPAATYVSIDLRGSELEMRDGVFKREFVVDVLTK